MKIGVIKEGKVPVDHRVPFSPEEAFQLNQFEGVESVLVQNSKVRAYKTKDYTNKGLKVVEDISSCDVLFGVKEVPIKDLIENKTYFFFSHTIKAQPYNRDLLRAVLEKNITLLDYECLTKKDGQRVVAFGRYAGIVGAYNALITYGKKFNLYNLKPANECLDMNEMEGEYQNLKLPAIKIALTGGGRVSKGAMEVLDTAGIQKVSVEDYLTKTFDKAVYTQLEVGDYNKTKDGSDFVAESFYQNPKKFETDFARFLPITDMLISGSFWNPDSPRLFTREDIASADFNIKVISDITCDIKGSIPSTIRPSTIDDPIYDYDHVTDEEAPLFENKERITVMGVDNLPCELPRNASDDFGKDLLKNVVPAFFDSDKDGVLERATIAKEGKLTPKYAYLQDYVDGK